RQRLTLRRPSDRADEIARRMLDESDRLVVALLADAPAQPLVEKAGIVDEVRRQFGDEPLDARLELGQADARLGERAVIAVNIGHHPTRRLARAVPQQAVESRPM